MAHVNVKRVALVLVALAAVAATAHLVRGYQLRRTSGALLRQVDRAEEEGRIDRALHVLGRYILLKPGDSTARPRYGQMLDARARTVRDKRVVMAVYEQALLRAGDRNDIRRRQAQLGVEVGDYDTAWGHLEILQQASPTDEEIESLLSRFPETDKAALAWLLAEVGELYLLQARCQEGKNRYADAVKGYKEAVKKYEDAQGLLSAGANQHTEELTEAYVRWAWLLRQRFDDRKQADQVIDALVRKHPSSALARVERAVYRHEFEGSLAGAKEDVAAALRLAGDDRRILPRALLLASQLAREQQDFAAARKHLERGLEVNPRAVALYQALADLELQAKTDEPSADRIARAVAWVRRGLKELPNQTDLLAALADLLIQQGNLDEAGEKISRLAQAGMPQAERTFLDARVLARKGKWREAARLLEGVRPLLAHSPALTAQADLLLGSCFQQLNDDRQLAVFRRAAGRDSKDVRACQGLAAALLLSNRIDESAAEYDRLTRLPGAPKAARLQLARVLILRNLQAPGAGRDWGRVHATLDQAAKDLAKAATPEQQTALVLLRAEALAGEAESEGLPAKEKAAKLAAARRLLDDARGQRPRDAEIRVALAGLAARQNDAAEVARVLDAARREAGDSVAVRLATVRYARLTAGKDKDPAAAQAAVLAVLADAARGAERFEKAQRLTLLRGLAEAHYALGNAAEALRLAKAVAVDSPGELRIRLLAFDAALKGDDAEGMQDALKEIEKINGEGALWHYGQARYHVWQAAPPRSDLRQLAAAHGHLGEAARLHKTWSRVPLCRGEALELEGKTDEAIESYQLAIDLGDRQPAVVEHLVKLLYDRGRYAQAEEALAKLEALRPISPDLQRLAAEAFLQKPDFDRALDLARKLVNRDSKNYNDHIWYAKVLFLTRKYDEARKPLDRALELAGDVGVPWIALVQYHMAMSRPEQAREAIRQAQAKLSPKEAPLALGHCFEAVGDLKEAEHHYKAAVAASPAAPAALRAAAEFYLRNGRSAEAIPHLRKLGQAATESSEGEKAWARRELALCLAGTGDYAQFMEALGLLGGAGGEAASVEDQRAKALALAAHPAYRADAARAFEALKKRARLRAEEQFQLAKLYDALDRAAEARRGMQDALALDPGNKTYLVHYALVLLRQNRRNDASLVIEQLRGLGAWDFDAVSLQARAMASDAGAAKAEQVARLVAEYVAHKDAFPADPVRRRELAARLLDELGEEFPGLGEGVAREAEKWYREYVPLAEEKNPEARLRYVGFLGRQRRPADVLAECEKALRRCPPERVAAACAVSLQAACAGPEHYAALERWLLPALAKAPGAAGLVEALATAREYQGRFAEAERLYRELLAAQPNNLVALNNLAYLLALSDGPKDEALRLAKRAVEVIGPVAEVLDTQAVVHLSMGQGAKAMEDLKQALAQKTPPPTVRFHLAQAHEKLGEREDATRLLRELRKPSKPALTPEALHPLERPALTALRVKLAVP